MTTEELLNLRRTNGDNMTLENLMQQDPEFKGFAGFMMDGLDPNALEESTMATRLLDDFYGKNKAPDTNMADSANAAQQQYDQQDQQRQATFDEVAEASKDSVLAQLESAMQGVIGSEFLAPTPREDVNAFGVVGNALKDIPRSALEYASVFNPKTAKDLIASLTRLGVGGLESLVEGVTGKDIPVFEQERVDPETGEVIRETSEGTSPEQEFFSSVIGQPTEELLGDLAENPDETMANVMSKATDYIVERPVDAALNLITFGTLAMATKKAFTGKKLNVLGEAMETASKKRKLKAATEMITPDPKSQKNIATALREDTLQEGVIRSRKIKLNKEQQKIADTISDIPGIKPSNTRLNNARAVRKEITNVSDNVAKTLRKNNKPFNRRTLNARLNKKQASNIKTFGFVVEDANQYKQVIALWDEVLDEMPKNNMAELWEARKRFDSKAENLWGDKIFDPSRDSPRAAAVRNVRQSTNEFIQENMDLGEEFLSQMDKMTQMYNGLDLAVPVIKKEAGNALDRWAQKWDARIGRFVGNGAVRTVIGASADTASLVTVTPARIVWDHRVETAIINTIKELEQAMDARTIPEENREDATQLIDEARNMMDGRIPVNLVQ